MFSHCTLVTQNKVGLQDELNHIFDIGMLTVSEELKQKRNSLLDYEKGRQYKMFLCLMWHFVLFSASS